VSYAIGHGSEFPEMPKEMASRSRCKWCDRDHSIFEICMSNPSYVLPLEAPASDEVYKPLIAVDTSKEGDFACKVGYQVRDGVVVIKKIEYL